MTWPLVKKFLLDGADDVEFDRSVVAAAAS